MHYGFSIDEYRFLMFRDGSIFLGESLAIIGQKKYVCIVTIILKISYTIIYSRNHVANYGVSTMYNTMQFVSLKSSQRKNTSP